jgi:serine/threonine-protein kinase
MITLKPPRIVGRYAIHTELASGGMGTVWLGRLVGPTGFWRIVAVKCLHPHLARDPELVTMFVDEARLAAWVGHPNVVQTVDIVTDNGEPFVVMDYLHGETLAKLINTLAARGEPVPPSIASAIGVNVLLGLHAAHETRNNRGELLGIVHGDVSPQNVLVGADGVARLLGFGIARPPIDFRLMGEEPHQGKIGGRRRRREADVCRGDRRLGDAHRQAPLQADDDERDRRTRDRGAEAAARTLSPSVDAVILRGLASVRGRRHATAREMAIALHALPPSPPREVGVWVESLAGDALASVRRRSRR